MAKWTDWLPDLISAGGSVAGSIIGSRGIGKATDKTVAASEKAAELERLSTKEALELEKEMYNRGIQMNYPWLQIGSQALTPFGRGMGLPEPEGGYSVPTLKNLMLPTTPGTSDAGGAPSSADAGSLGTSPGLAPSSTVKPGGTLGPVAKGALSGAGAGALAGSFLGPGGTAAGAAIGGLTGLIGRGRKEADQIVPYQNALTAEFGSAIERIKAKDASGALSPADWQAEIARLEPLYNEYQGLIQRFGRAGPGAQQSTAYMGNMLNEWKGYAGLPGRAKGGPVGGGRYIVGEQGPEVLEMEPGSEGYVYPHSSFMGMMKAKQMPMPGREAGGPVGGYSWQQLEMEKRGIKPEDVLNFDPNTGQIQYTNAAGARVTTGLGGSAQAKKPQTPNIPAGNTVTAGGVSGPYYDFGTPGPGGTSYEDFAKSIGISPEQSYAERDQFVSGAGNMPIYTAPTPSGPTPAAGNFSPPPFSQNNRMTLSRAQASSAQVPSVQDLSTTPNPYAGMTAPFDTTPGEFMAPWQGEFKAPVSPRPFEFNAEDLYNDPSYQFRFNEGAKASERMASAGGRVLGGRTLKELMRYGQDFASNEFGQAYGRALGENQLAYGRDTDQYNRLLNEYGIKYDIFKQNQADRYNRLKSLTGIV